MKFMTVWTIAPENMKEAIKRFKEIGDVEGVTRLGSWHEVGTGKGYTLNEADDPIAMSKNTLQWSDLIDIKVVPVVDDEEMGKALGW